MISSAHLDQEPDAQSEPTLGAIYAHEILERLSGKDAAVLKIRYLEGEPYEVIGRMLGVSPGTARVCLYRALRRAREQYGE